MQQQHWRPLVTIGNSLIMYLSILSIISYRSTSEMALAIHNCKILFLARQVESSTRKVRSIVVERDIKKLTFVMFVLMCQLFLKVKVCSPTRYTVSFMLGIIQQIHNKNNQREMYSVHCPLIACKMITETNIEDACFLMISLKIIDM